MWVAYHLKLSWGLILKGPITLKQHLMTSVGLRYFYLSGTFIQDLRVAVSVPIETIAVIIVRLITSLQFFKSLTSAKGILLPFQVRIINYTLAVCVPIETIAVIMLHNSPIYNECQTQ